MTRSNRNKILVPEARKGMDDLKAKVVGADHPPMQSSKPLKRLESLYKRDITVN